MESTVKLTQEDFNNSRPLALAGFVIGQEISKADYDKYMAEGGAAVKASSSELKVGEASGTSTADEEKEGTDTDVEDEGSPTAEADEAAKEQDAKSADETEGGSPTKEAEEAAKEEDAENEDAK